MALNYNIRLELRKDKKRKSDNTCPVFAIISIQGKRLLKCSTGQRGKEEDWNSKTRNFKGKGYKILNRTLNNFVNNIEDYIREEELKGNRISAEMIKNFLKGKDLLCFYNFFENDFTKNKLSNLSKSTIDKYLLLVRRLKQFKTTLYFHEIDVNFLYEFRFFLQTKLGLGKSAIWNMEKNFKSVIKFAYDTDKCDNYPFKNFKLNKPKHQIKALTLEEVKKIDDLYLEEEIYDVIRKMFLFSCYTGLRFGDVANLEWTSISNNMIKIVQQKTKNPVKVPIKEEAGYILNYFETFDENQKKIFPKVSNQRCNKVLKKIAEMAGIDKNLTFHMSRHTFGTSLVKNNVNAFLVGELMGHRKLETTKGYMDFDRDILSETMENVKFA